MKTYEGIHSLTGLAVFRPDGTPLPPRLDLRNHSPTGFSAGYGGSGPAQLALALLADVFDDDIALEHYQDFKWAVIARLPRDKPWTLTVEQIRQAVKLPASPKHTPLPLTISEAVGWPGLYDVLDRDENPLISHATKDRARLVVRAVNVHDALVSACEALLWMVCDVCRRLNPQHEECNWCQTTEKYRKTIATARGKA